MLASSPSCRRWAILFLATTLLAGSITVYCLWFSRAVPEAQALRAFVRNRPPVAVVFTSRSESASLQAPAPEAEGFTYPGTIPWAAREGRLRLLDTNGKVYELTWGRKLDDGSTIIDVMSPTISMDGERVLFAGRKSAPDAGRWRIYQVDISGHNLKQLTGLPDDTGCIAAPPMRFAINGQTLSEEERRKLDYDDVDPCDDGNGGVIFCSSRIPDLGRDHTRRATQIWYRPGNATAPRSLTANRNNDRWPFLCRDSVILFSSWSRNREVVTADGREIVPYVEGGQYLTQPTDLWTAARVFPDSSQFGYAIKGTEPVWRPRPLFNGRVVFMTTSTRPNEMRLAQADWGYLRAAPSSLAQGSVLPRQVGDELRYGPPADEAGQELDANCPSPCPENRIIFSGKRRETPATGVGLYICDQEWAGSSQILFDDPDFVDSEPVAVYPRGIVTPAQTPPAISGQQMPDDIALVNGKKYSGSMGFLDNNMINAEMPDPFPAQQTDAGTTPVIPYPKTVKSLVFYASQRDRFNDPVKPRIPGEWQKLFVSPLNKQGHMNVWVPADPLEPSVLAGLDESGRIAQWSGAKDRNGQAGRFLAIAGDHYSGTRSNGYHFCLGCHTGHTFIKADIAERKP